MLPYIDIPFVYLATLAGASVDELKLIFSFLLSYPLAALLKRVPDTKPWQKNLFCISVSIFYLVGLFDLWNGLITLLISSVGAYLIADRIRSPYMPWIGFVFLMGHMSISHLYRQFADSPDLIDITGAQMVLVMKLTAFCWNVFDGRLQEDQMAEFQKTRAIREMPGILDYAGYVLFFPSLFAGPAFDYVDYKQWIETTMFEIPKGVDASKAPKTRKKRKIPRSGIPALLKAGQGLSWIVMFLLIGHKYDSHVVLGEQMLAAGFLKRLFYLHMLGFTTRLKYYGVWALTEGACILSGIGYRGIDPKTQKISWNRLQNVNPLGIELAQNSRAYLENWNMNTNHWLRNYVYLRVTPKGQKPGFRASLATFATSAFWHGFYPGYYLTFVLGSFLQTLAKNVRRNVRPLFLTPDGSAPTSYKPLYDIISWFFTQVAFAFTTAPFVILALPESLQVWGRVYYSTIVGVALGMAFFASPAKTYLVKLQRQRLRNAGIEVADKARTKPDSDSRSVKQKPPFSRTASKQSGPVLGLPDDPQRDLDEAMKEISAEMNRRSSITAQDLKNR